MQIAIRQETPVIQRLLFQMANKKDLYRNIGEDQIESTMENFKHQGRPEKWEPLSPKTIVSQFQSGNTGRKNRRRVKTRSGKVSKSFARYNAGKKILVDKGVLMGSIMYEIAWDGVAIGPSGPAVDYGKAHQAGTDTIPPRPFVVVLQSDSENMKKQISKHFFKR